MGDFVMPSLGADMDAGTVVEWRVRPGDRVHRGDIVAVVDTDKSDIEVEIFEDGLVEELLVEPGRDVPVGTPLARIAPVPATPAAITTSPPSVPTPEPATPQPTPAEPTKPVKPHRRKRRPAAAPERVRSSPLARRLATEGDVDLAAVTGSGPGGAVLAADLPGAPSPAGPPPPAPTPPTTPPWDRLAAMRQATGELMARSKREIPHYHLGLDIDLSPALRWLAEVNSGRPVTGRLLPAAILLKATALAARDHPTLNGHWDDGFKPATAVHLGVAVSLRGGGLVAPAIADADARTLDDLMTALRDLVTRVRTGRLRSSDVAGATLTVTNLGDQGADLVHGVIYPPQVALVGFGRIAERPWAEAGMLGVRPSVNATLAGDHRVSDGHEGSRFLATIDRLLHTPEAL